MTSERIADHGAMVVITHRARNNKLAEYEEWLTEIAPLARASPGNLDWHIVRPIPGLTATFTIILRFDSDANLRDSSTTSAWLRGLSSRCSSSRSRSMLLFCICSSAVDSDRPLIVRPSLASLSNAIPGVAA
jgi:antibiotic biosynthesis monooxygenase (ABM) superfamily enzyme